MSCALTAVATESIEDIAAAKVAATSRPTTPVGSILHRQEHDGHSEAGLIKKHCTFFWSSANTKR
jgi:hypothetical protein